MANSIRKQNYRHVRIDSHNTLFWRFQSLSREYLSTVEAVYWFFVEFHQSTEQSLYDGRYDDILFLFKAKYYLIQDYYKKTNRTFTRRHAESSTYIE